jgi:hypothetical protein
VRAFRLWAATVHKPQKGLKVFFFKYINFNVSLDAVAVIKILLHAKPILAGNFVFVLPFFREIYICKFPTDKSFLSNEFSL